MYPLHDINTNWDKDKEILCLIKKTRKETLNTSLAVNVKTQIIVIIIIFATD